MSQWGRRVCSACGYDLDEEEFSSSQWSKPVGISRCKECVREDIRRDAGGFDAARFNNATRISVNINNIDSEGSNRYCSYGHYAGGPRTGQMCVAKRYKDGGDHFDCDLDCVEKAQHIITQWNQSRQSDDHIIRINIPEKWTIDGIDCLVEPYIEGFFKMNSNTGWCSSDQSRPVQLLQALSHYSYHISSGQFVLCDLQGGVYRDYIILTDPVVLSRSRRFGTTDLGAEGISTFFSYHQCNRYCCSDWTQPRDQRNYFRPTPHTTIAGYGNSSYMDDDDDDDDSEY